MWGSLFIIRNADGFRRPGLPADRALLSCSLRCHPFHFTLSSENGPVFRLRGRARGAAGLELAWVCLFFKVNFLFLDNCSFTCSVRGNTEILVRCPQFPHWPHPRFSGAVSIPEYGPWKVKKQKLPSPWGPSGCSFTATPPDSRPLFPKPGDHSPHP